MELEGGEDDEDLYAARFGTCTSSYCFYSHTPRPFATGAATITLTSIIHLLAILSTLYLYYMSTDCVILALPSIPVSIQFCQRVAIGRKRATDYGRRRNRTRTTSARSARDSSSDSPSPRSRPDYTTVRTPFPFPVFRCRCRYGEGPCVGVGVGAPG